MQKTHTRNKKITFLHFGGRQGVGDTLNGLHKLLERLFAFGSHNFLRGMQTVREAFSWLPDANAYAYRMLSEGPKMNNSLRQ